MSMQKTTFFSLIVITFIIACVKVPITNRKQMKLLPESMLQNMSLTEYKKVITAGPLSKNTTDVNRIKNIGSNVSVAIATYLKSHNGQSRLDGVNWEFNLIESNLENAWCMPGGKVAFYSGLLPLCKDDNGIAVVMGHEIAHAIARHGNERMSQQMLLQTGQITLALAMQSKPQETQKLFMTAYGIGTEVGLALPYSRMHESEADKMGLIFMAMAGYDPKTAIDFWKRMSQAGGQKPPQILSTHPSDEKRIKDLQDFMPQALKYYNKK